jgi:hypothetical protein
MNPLPVQPCNKFSNSKKIIEGNTGQNPEKKHTQSRKQLERLHSPQVAALLSGPIPRRYIPNRWHEFGYRLRVYELNRRLPELERLARTGERNHVLELYRHYMVAMVDHGDAIDGLFLHREAAPETREELRLWQSVVEVADRVRRLKKVMELMRYERSLWEVAA